MTIRPLNISDISHTRVTFWKEPTTAVAIYQEVVRMSDGTAAALATILTVTTIISLLIVFRLTKGKVKIV